MIRAFWAVQMPNFESADVSTPSLCRVEDSALVVSSVPTNSEAFMSKYRLEPPENYLILLSIKQMIGSKYATNF